MVDVLESCFDVIHDFYAFYIISALGILNFVHFLQSGHKVVTDRRTDGPTDGPTDRPTDGPTDRPTDRPSVGPPHPRVDSYLQRFTDSPLFPPWLLDACMTKGTLQ